MPDPSEASPGSDASPALPGPSGSLELKSSIRVAFAVGWQVGELLRLADGSSDVEDDGERTELILHAVKAGVIRLQPHLQQVSVADIPLPSEMRRVDSTVVIAAGAREGLRRLDADLRIRLTAADFRLGKAYRLGRDLAETCLTPEDPEAFDRMFGTRMVDIRDRLADLATALPAHSSRAVALSLRTWERWAAEPVLDGMPLDEDAWKTHWPGVRAALRRQGQLWRALLSGEKDGRDMLQVDDYLNATARLLRQTARIMFGVRRPVLAITIALTVAALLIGGIALFTFTGSKATAAFITALGAIGLTGAGVRRFLSSTATQIQQWLWNGELDLAIAHAITIGPSGWGVEVDVELPAAGGEPGAADHLKTLAEFRGAVVAGKRKRIEALLAPAVEFSVDESAKPISAYNWRAGGRRDANAIDPVAWVLANATQCRLAEEPSEIVAGDPGRFVAHLDDGTTHFWRVREGKIRAWANFSDRNAARARAGLPSLAAAPDSPRV